MTNKTVSTGSVWQGNSIALAYGGTGSSLSAVAGAVAWSGASGLALTAAGTSGQLLVSGGTNSPTWQNASSISVGSATTASLCTNVAGGSAGNLVYQFDTGTTGFIASGATGTFLQSTGASTAPTWAAGQVTVGSTAISLGATQTAIAGLTSINATAGSTSFFATPTAPVLFAAATSLTLGNATAATLTVNPGTVVGANTTQAVFNTVATTVNAFGAATTLTLGATTGSTTIRNDVTISGNLTINGTTTTTSSANTTYADSLLELHYSNGGTLTSDDGKDIGFRFHYYKTSDKNAALVFDNATQQLEYFVDGTETSGTFSGTYGIFKGAGLNLAGSTSGVTAIVASAVAGTTTLTLPAVTDTLVGLTATQTLTNKTLTSPTLTTPSLGVATATSINGLTISTTTGTLTLANSSTLATSGAFSTTLTATATTTLTLPTTGTLATLAGTETFTNKTLTSPTINSATANNLTLTGTLTANASVGSSGQVLASTGSGVQWSSPTISLAGTSGSGSVALGGTITFASNNGITASVSGSTITVSSPQDVRTSASPQFTSLGVGVAAGTTGEIRASYNITSNYSDDRLKDRGTNIENALEKVLSLNGFHYTPNQIAQDFGYPMTEEVGVSAQEVQAVLPEIVVAAPIDDQYLTVRYERLVPLLIEAIKEQQAQIEELKAKLGK
jgi:hypothetical protein